MKPTEKAALWAAGGGVVLGAGLAWLLPGAAWWVPVGFGFLVAAGAYGQIVKDMAAKRIADGETGASDKG